MGNQVQQLFSSPQQQNPNTPIHNQYNPNQGKLNNNISIEGNNNLMRPNQQYHNTQSPSHNQSTPQKPNTSVNLSQQTQNTPLVSSHAQSINSPSLTTSKDKFKGVQQRVSLQFQQKIDLRRKKLGQMLSQGRTQVPTTLAQQLKVSFQ